MKIVHKPTEDEIKAARASKYIQLWPITKQMEAYAEEAMNRPEKLQAMLKDFTEIREKFPFANKEE